MTTPHGAQFSASPYPGLRPFSRNEMDIFFGREEQTDEILNRLHRTRFLAVVGSSGSGKSSLVSAGMIASLEAGFMVGAQKRWLVAEMRPGNHPVRRLAEALLAPTALGMLRSGEDDAAWLQATLGRPSGLKEALRETPLPEETGLLLVVDQFEEIFRFRHEGGVEEADAFINLLLTDTGEGRLPIYTVLTMRSDYLGDCAVFKGLPQKVSESQYLTPQMTREQREAAIIGPARVFGGKVQPELVARLLNDMGEDPSQLPLLQHTLMRIWDEACKRRGKGADTRGGSLLSLPKAERVEMTLDDYEKVGVLGAALSLHANKVLEELKGESAAYARLAEVLFRALTVRDTGQRDTRRPARLGSVARTAGLGEAETRDLYSVIEAFRRADRSFLMPPPEVALDADVVLDISHESLIRHWDTLKVWVAKEAESADTYRQLKYTARLWDKGEAELKRGRDLKRALRWLHEENPTPEWAARYDGEEKGATRTSAENLALVQKFLNQSRRWSRWRDGFIYTLITLSTAGVIIFLILWAEQRSTRQVLKATEKARDEARAAKELAEQRLVDYEREKARAEEAENDLDLATQNMELYGGPPPLAAAGDTAEVLGLRARGQPIRPGASVSSLSQVASVGSMCCVVRDAAGQQYILSLNFVLEGNLGTPVVQPGAGDGGMRADQVAELSRKSDDARGGALARILPGKKISLEVPGIGAIRDTAAVQPGEEVWLIGRTSGRVRGKVIGTENGEIITTRISSPGDAGAPVLTPDGRLVGLLAARHSKGSIVMPIEPILRELSVELVRP